MMVLLPDTGNWMLVPQFLRAGGKRGIAPRRRTSRTPISVFPDFWNSLGAGLLNGLRNGGDEEMLLVW